jgi:hypothetical protein
MANDFTGGANEIKYCKNTKTVPISKENIF